MNKIINSENSIGYMDLSGAGGRLRRCGDPTDLELSVNESRKMNGSSQDTFNENAFFSLLNENWSKLLLLVKQLRDTMQFYSQKKQELSWGLEINALQQNFKAIDHSYAAAVSTAIGGMASGVLMIGGASCGGIGAAVGNGMGQVANGIGSYYGGGENREADAERAIAGLQSKGAQSYAKTLDDTLMKAREIVQQIMEMRRSLVELSNQALRAISR